MSSLPTERRNQLLLASRAIDNGDRDLAAAYFFEGIEGFLERVDEVLSKNDIPAVRGKPAPKPERKPTSTREQHASKYAAKRAQAVEIFQKFPDTSIPRLAVQLRVSETYLRELKKELGLPAAPRKWGAMGQDYLAKRAAARAEWLRPIRELLLAEPDISTFAASKRLNVSEPTVHKIRRELGLPPKAKHEGRDIRQRYLNLIDRYPQISDRDAAQRLECSHHYIKLIRSAYERDGTIVRYGQGYKKRPHSPGS